MECDGLLISFCIKLILLLLGSWAVFFRQPKATMPRIYLYRAFLTMLLMTLTFTFWLFFSVRISGEQRRRVQYFDIVQYALSMTDALLFVHYLALMLIELKHLSPDYYIKIVRSPDGESRNYSIGPLSIQRAAVWVLQKYYIDFPIYNPYLERLPGTQSGLNGHARFGRQMANSSYKYYDVDGLPANHAEKVSWTI